MANCCMWPICSQLPHWAYNQVRNACSSCGERTVCGRLLVSGIVFFDIPASPPKSGDTAKHCLSNLHSARTPVYGTRIRDPKTGAGALYGLVKQCTPVSPASISNHAGKKCPRAGTLVCDQCPRLWIQRLVDIYGLAIRAETIHGLR